MRRINGALLAYLYACAFVFDVRARMLLEKCLLFLVPNLECAHPRLIYKRCPITSFGIAGKASYVGVQADKILPNVVLSFLHFDLLVDRRLGKYGVNNSICQNNFGGFWVFSVFAG